jgi:Flp pilus assembly protein TadG
VHRRNRSIGQALVELALALPVIVLLVFGLVDLGRAVYAWTAISNAAREGARLAIVNQAETAGVSEAAREAAEQATGLGIDPADPAQVAVAYRSADLASACPARAIGCVAEVRVRYQFMPVTPVIGQIVGPITLAATTQIPIESTNP